MPVIDAAACHYTTWNASQISAAATVVAIGAGYPPEISTGTQIALAPPGGCDTRFPVLEVPNACASSSCQRTSAFVRTAGRRNPAMARDADPRSDRLPSLRERGDLLPGTDRLRRRGPGRHGNVYPRRHEPARRCPRPSGAVVRFPAGP